MPLWGFGSENGSKHAAVRAVHGCWLAAALHNADRLRRLAGNALDAAGLGPRETPWQPVHTAAFHSLRRYAASPGATPAGMTGAPTLLVPAPIKRPYIFDLLPKVSVVRRCLDAGFATYLLAWLNVCSECPEAGLDEFTHAIAEAAAAITHAEGRRPIVIAHSLGGTLAALSAASRPQLPAGLVLIEAPLRFGEHAGALRTPVALSPPVWEIARLLGGAPGSLLDFVSLAAVPDEFAWNRWFDAWRSFTDPDALRVHTLVLRWTLDELALPARLFAELVEHLYREDRFGKNELTIAGARALPGALAAVPVAAVVDPLSRLVLPASTLSLLSEATIFRYEREIGVALQHVGPLVGRRAHRLLWPRIIAWMRAHG
jgi:polyhydroxyalkanoate synthase